MIEEMTALWANHKWDLVSLSFDHTPVGCKWVFIAKHNPDGMVDRLQARLVACRFTQQHDLEKALPNALTSAPSMWILGNAGMGALQLLLANKQHLQFQVDDVKEEEPAAADHDDAVVSEDK
ncbi:hypothetical protein KSP39_PZI011741 [Platanthera zijinensis]|uniref:Uncharacterized protein n=1 Tax=Platanthera zijinensis TaxID=2320716 RepID=A0AAP0BE41_9ASPA